MVLPPRTRRPSSSATTIQAVIQVNATYTDLGATITGPQADLNHGIKTFLARYHPSRNGHHRLRRDRPLGQYSHLPPPRDSRTCCHYPIGCRYNISSNFSFTVVCP